MLAGGGDQVAGVAAQGELFDQRARAGELGLVIGDEGGDGGVGARGASVGGRARRALGDEKTLDAGETIGDALGVTLDETHLALATGDVGEFDAHGVALEGDGAKRAAEAQRLLVRVRDLVRGQPLGEREVAFLS